MLPFARMRTGRRKLSAKLLVLGMVMVGVIMIFAFVALLREEGHQSGPHRQRMLVSSYRMNRQMSAGHLTDDEKVSKDQLVIILRNKLKAAAEANGTKHTKKEGPLEASRVAEYCNIPSDLQQGQEGEVPEGYQLSAVYLLIRHGDRTPMTTILNIPRPSPPEGCVMDAKLLEKTPEIRNFIRDMQASKGKQPVSSEFLEWSLFPQHAQCGNSQLTGIGALQHLHNGLILREKYVKKWNLFGQTFLPLQQLQLKTTQYSRTYQSLVALLYGFLPYFNLTELNIQGVRSNVFCDPEFMPQSCCLGLPHLKGIADRRAYARLKNTSSYAAAMSAFADVFDVKVSSALWPTSIIDTLQGHACHGIKLPCGPNNKCVTSSILEQMWALVDKAGLESTEDKDYDRYCRLSMQSFLQEIMIEMVKVSRNHSTVKFSAFSGHDITVSPLLQALGLHDGKWPHYGTRVVFELYKKVGMEGKNYIRILLNGRDMTDQVKFCHGYTDRDGLCQLKRFLNFVQNENLDFLDTNSLEIFCDSLSKM